MYAVDDSAHRNRQLESKGKGEREKWLAGSEVGQVPHSVNDPVISQCNDIFDFTFGTWHITNIVIIVIIIRRTFLRWLPSGTPKHMANADHIRTTAGIKTIIILAPINPYHLMYNTLSLNSVFWKNKSQKSFMPWNIVVEVYSSRSLLTVAEKVVNTPST